MRKKPELKPIIDKNIFIDGAERWARFIGEVLFSAFVCSLIIVGIVYVLLFLSSLTGV